MDDRVERVILFYVILKILNYLRIAGSPDKFAAQRRSAPFSVDHPFRFLHSFFSSLLKKRDGCGCAGVC